MSGLARTSGGQEVVLHRPLRSYSPEMAVGLVSGILAGVAI
jgi:hypothetical protein